MQFGLPLKCPKCPPRHYFGILKGSSPTAQVKLSKLDRCPNCRTQLVVTLDKIEKDTA